MDQWVKYSVQAWGLGLDPHHKSRCGCIHFKTQWWWRKWKEDEAGSYWPIQPGWNTSEVPASVRTPFSTNMVVRNRGRNLTLTSDLYMHTHGWMHLTHPHTWKLKPFILTQHHNFYHLHFLYNQEQLANNWKERENTSVHFSFHKFPSVSYHLGLWNYLKVWWFSCGRNNN